jgi:hypothetical protein
LLQELKYLTFEINKTCNLTKVHDKCPINDPERYKFGNTQYELDEDIIHAFWTVCVSRGFRGIVLWHLYNEPTQKLVEIQRMLARMRKDIPDQRSHLWTNSPNAKPEGFDHIELTDYRVIRPQELDSRRTTVEGEGDYTLAPQNGVCGRSKNWEIIIDFHGNWITCCNDWRCEGSLGNLFTHPWTQLFQAYEKRAVVQWGNETSFNAMSRMCRACVTYNTNLHRTAMPPKSMVSRW